LEKLSIKDIFYSGKSLTDNLTPEIGEISAELNKEVDNLKKDIKNTKIQGAQTGGAHNKYNFILDPDTKEIYYLNSPKGIKLLKKYKTLVNL